MIHPNAANALTGAPAVYIRLARDRWRVEQSIANLQWWQFRERRIAYAKLRDREFADDLGGASIRCADELLTQALRVEWSSGDAAHHPLWHPRMLEQLSPLGAAAAAHARELLVDESKWPRALPARWCDEPLVGPQLSQDHAEAMITRRVSELQEYVADPRIYVRTSGSGNEVIVQHKMTGLRARFQQLEGGFGVVESKPYDIASINPDRPGQSASDHVHFKGFGVGTRLYAVAANELPMLRWTQGITSTDANWLRRKLHAADPLRWAATCGWCAENGIRWERAAESEFAGHPVAPLALPTPQIIRVS